MKNTPLRAAFWTLLVSAALLATAATTDPYEMKLAMAVPPAPPLDANPLDLDRPPIGEPFFDPVIVADAATETDPWAERLSGPVVATADFPRGLELPRPGSIDLGPSEPFEPAASFAPPSGDGSALAVADSPYFGDTHEPPPQPIGLEDAVAAIETPAVDEPIRVAAQGDQLQLELDAAERPDRTTTSRLAGSPRWGGAQSDRRLDVQRMVPLPMDLVPESLGTAVEAPDAIAATRPVESLDVASVDSRIAATQSLPSPPMRSVLQPERMTTGRGGRKANGNEAFVAELFPNDASVSRDDEPQADAEPIRVAQLDLLKQLKDLQTNKSKRDKQLAGSKELRKTLAAAGASMSDDVEAEIEDAEELETESKKTVQPEFESTGRDADGNATFTLQIADANIAQVLEMIGEIGGLNIVMNSAPQGTVPNNLYEVSVDEALDALGHGFDLEYEKVGRFLHVSTRAAADARRDAARKRVSKVYRPGFVAVRDLEALITPLLTPGIGIVSVSAPAENGIAASNVEAGGDSLAQPDALVVIDYAEKIAEIDELVRQMDIAPPQVAIDAVIMQVRLNDQLNLGVNLAFAGDGNNDLLISGNGAAINSSAGLPLPTVSGTGGVAETIIEPLGRFVAGSGGLSFGYLRGDFSALFDALEKITDVSLVASPHVQVVNKQKAEILIVERLGYKTLNFNNTQTIENVQFLDAGTKLLLRPFVGPNGLIRLEVHPERSSAQIDPISGLPNQQTTEVTTNVLVKDGETLVIGGLIEEQTVVDEEQVPLLGSIPVVGRLFQNSAEQVIRTELIVLLTPRLVREHDAHLAANLAGEFADRADEFHDSITPVARTRLADLHRRKAEEAFAKGDPVEALHHAEKTLYLAPNDLRALRLRDQISNGW